jgi:hypothetical protein
VEASGLRCQRGDEFSGALIHKEILRAVIASDVMVADVSHGNPNVMYELGMRHALRPATTILIRSRNSRLPFNISHLFTLVYEVGRDGGPEAASNEAVRARLTQVLRDRSDGLTPDSPLFEYFPELRADIPSSIAPRRVSAPAGPGETPAARGIEPVARGAPPGAVVDAAAPSAGRAAAGAETVVAAPSPAAAAAVDQARQRRLASDLRQAAQRVQALLSRGQPANALRLIQGMAPELARTRPIRLLEAQTLTQLDDADAAVSALAALVEEQPDDAATLALWGSLLKKRHFQSGSEADLRGALDLYRRAFGVNPQDLYVGRNLAQLLDRLDDDASRAELECRLPELEALARHALDQPPADYWTLQSALLIAALARSEDPAAERLESMLALEPEAWMRDATARELEGMQQRGSDARRAPLLARLLQRLAAAASAEAQSAADSAEDDAGYGDAKL